MDLPEKFGRLAEVRQQQGKRAGQSSTPQHAVDGARARHLLQSKWSALRACNYLIHSDRGRKLHRGESDDTAQAAMQGELHRSGQAPRGSHAPPQSPCLSPCPCACGPWAAMKTCHASSRAFHPAGETTVSISLLLAFRFPQEMRALSTRWPSCLAQQPAGEMAAKILTS